MIETCLIPPFSLLPSIQDRPYHLLLSHLLENQEYREFYSALNGDQYLILDNSAHELGEGRDFPELLHTADTLGAQEVVVPDCLFDGSRTLQLTSQALQGLRYTYYPAVRRLMLVAQGRSYSDWQQCLWGQVSLWQSEASRIVYYPTLGVSKDYEIWPGGILELLRRHIIPAADQIGAEIHLLGWGHDLWALREISRQFGSRIRSTDSAKPYVYGLKGVSLNPRYLDIPVYPKRDADYFEQTPLSETMSIINHNIAVFDATARGEVI